MFVCVCVSLRLEACVSLGVHVAVCDQPVCNNRCKRPCAFSQQAVSCATVSSCDPLSRTFTLISFSRPLGFPLTALHFTFAHLCICLSLLYCTLCVFSFMSGGFLLPSAPRPPRRRSLFLFSPSSFLFERLFAGGKKSTSLSFITALSLLVQFQFQFR